MAALKDFDHGRACQPHGDACRIGGERQRRQDQMRQGIAECVEAAGDERVDQVEAGHHRQRRGDRDLSGKSAGEREDTKPLRKDELQDHGQEKRRHGDGRDRAEATEPVGPTALPRRSDDTERNADQERKNGRKYGELQGGRNIGPEILCDEAPGFVGNAEIGGGHGAGESRETGRKRRVEIEFLARLLDLLGRGTRARIERCGVRRYDLCHHEDQEGHAHQNEGGEKRAAQDVA
ncbi:hypothetical protein D9M68_706610 [compost metagenome]